MKDYIEEVERDYQKLAKRMDKFDSLVTEYLRANHYTTMDLSFQLSIDQSTLWRYRNRPEYFGKAPFETIMEALRLAKCSDKDLHYICGV